MLTLGTYHIKQIFLCVSPVANESLSFTCYGLYIYLNLYGNPVEGRRGAFQ